MILAAPWQWSPTFAHTSYTQVGSIFKLEGPHKCTYLRLQHPFKATHLDQVYVDITMKAAKENDAVTAEQYARESIRIARTTRELLKKFSLAHHVYHNGENEALRGSKGLATAVGGGRGCPRALHQDEARQDEDECSAPGLNLSCHDSC